MRMVWVAIVSALAGGAGVYGGMTLWSGQEAERQARLQAEAEAARLEKVEWCMLRKEYWSRVTPEFRTPEPECVALGIIEP